MTMFNVDISIGEWNLLHNLTQSDSIYIMFNVISYNKYPLIGSISAVGRL